MKKLAVLVAMGGLITMLAGTPVQAASPAPAAKVTAKTTVKATAKTTTTSHRSMRTGRRSHWGYRRWHRRYRSMRSRGGNG